jgi:hypothetical protein
MTEQSVLSNEPATTMATFTDAETGEIFRRRIVRVPLVEIYEIISPAAEPVTEI